MRKSQTSNIEEAQPKIPAELRREGRLARIAKALVSGATVTEIAEAEGIGRTLASREANSPEYRQLVAEFVSDEHTDMRALFYRSLRAIEQALSARREYMTKEGQIIYVKKRMWLAKGYGSFLGAWRTLQGIEAVHMIRKGRVRWLAKADSVGQARFITKLFGIAA